MAGGLAARAADPMAVTAEPRVTGTERAAIALVLIVTAAVFAAGLPAPFAFDDFADVVDNPAAQPPTFWSELPGTVRPLLKATYAANAVVHGPWAPGYRGVNLALHLLATFLVWRLARRLLGRTGHTGGAVAVVAAAMWAVHPAAVESVTRVSGRSAVLSGVLALAACLLATAPRPRRQAWPRTALLVVAAFAAPLARETALTLPAALLLWQLTLAPREGARAVLRRHLPVWVGVGLAAAVIVVLPRHRELVAFSLRAHGPLEAVRANLFAIPEMLSLVVRPWAIGIDPAAPAVTAWVSLPALLRALGLAAALTSVWLLRRRAGVVAFGIGWTMLWLLPSNSVVFRLDPVGVRPLYLASLGPVLAAAWVAARLSRVGRVAARLPVVAAGALVLALGGLTVAANRRACDPVAEWAHAASLAPGRARPHAALGYEYLRAGRLAEAERELAVAVDLEPWDGTARCALEGVRIDRAARRVAPTGGDG